RRAPRRAAVLQAQARSRRSGGAGAPRPDAKRTRMNDPENFIARWSRRKRAAADDATKPAAAPEQAAGPPADKPLRDENVRKMGGDPAGREFPFDPAPLPPLESITAESDVRAFLAPGVPPELTRAALRRAWATDPKVRDFVGL